MISVGVNYRRASRDGKAGACLGSVLAPQLDFALPVRKMRHAFCGPKSCDAEIEMVVRTSKICANIVSDPAAVATEMLANGKTLGWVQGRMDFGPRALGSRSILTDLRDPETNTKVRNAVKFRDWWRPFAPSMLAEAAGGYLESMTIRTFSSSGMDALIIGSFVVRK